MASGCSELIPSQLHNQISSITQTREEKSSSKGSSSNSKPSSEKKSKRKPLNKNAKEFLPSFAKDNEIKNDQQDKKPRRKPKPRRGRRKKVSIIENKDNDKSSAGGTMNPEEMHNQQNHANESQSMNENKQESNPTNKKRRNRNRKPKNSSQSSNTTKNTENTTASEKTEINDNNSACDEKKNPNKEKSKVINENTNVKTKQEKNKKSRGKKRKPKKKRYPWIEYLPEGSVDPISLDSLDTLQYPPFALVIEPPYIPIKKFPPLNQKEILSSSNQDTNDKSKQFNNLHLFDGKVLAYYLISQLQFIDPLNRRDLTRPELQALDNYLSENNLGQAHVVKAYDCKGVTISSAGREAQTVSGQARMLQEEARSILNALFSGQSTTNQSVDVNGTHSTFRNDFERQYTEHARRERSLPMNPGSMSNRNNQTNHNGNNILGNRIDDDDDDGGLLIIDDDENPGLRGGVYNNNQSRNSTGPWNSNNRNQPFGEELFPSLQETVETPDHMNQTNESLPQRGNDKQNDANGKPVISRSLQFISKTVSKTDPKEIAKQRKAREEMQRRAALSQMSLQHPSSFSHNNFEIPKSISTPNLHIPATAQTSDLDLQIERNRVLAQALNVAPASMRSNYKNSGWARPIKPDRDEFGNELNLTVYPDSLMMQAKERIGEILKLERRWNAFLLDDKASFVNLRPMLRDLRIIVHEYSDFWNLHTESFDKEPKRYINCKKLRDTRTPYPLLSDAIKNYKPTLQLTKPTGKTEVNAKAINKMAPREFPPGPERKPLPLLPRTVTDNPPDGAMFDCHTPATNAVNTEETIPSKRFEVLARERPKLSLEPRTIPRELPEYHSTHDALRESKMASIAFTEKQRRQQEKEEERNKRAESILAAAFASDDEVESDSSSEWSCEEPVYCSSDDEVVNTFGE